MSTRDLLLDITIGKFAGFHIDVQELNELIEMHGIGAEWRKAVRCPCLRVETMRPTVSCRHCNGLGYTHPESGHVPLIVFLLNRQPARKILQVGEYVTGQVTVTFPSPHIPGEGDLIVPDNEVHLVHDTIWRGGQQIDNRAMMARTEHPDQAPPKNRPPEERLRYPDVLEVQSIHWISAAGDLCEAKQGDYKLVKNQITWKAKRGPVVGSAYTVRYLAPAMYQLQPSEPIARMEATSLFPYRTTGYRLDRIGEPDQR